MNTFAQETLDRLIEEKIIIQEGKTLKLNKKFIKLYKNAPQGIYGTKFGTLTQKGKDIMDIKRNYLILTTRKSQSEEEISHKAFMLYYMMYNQGEFNPEDYLSFFYKNEEVGVTDYIGSEPKKNK
jgi:hypothetical protein